MSKTYILHDNNAVLSMISMLLFVINIICLILMSVNDIDNLLLGSEFVKTARKNLLSSFFIETLTKLFYLIIKITRPNQNFFLPELLLNEIFGNFFNKTLLFLKRSIDFGETLAYRREWNWLRIIVLQFPENPFFHNFQWNYL